MGAAAAQGEGRPAILTAQSSPNRGSHRRDTLIRLGMDLEGHIRGVLKTYGVRLTGISRGHQRQGFRDQLAAVGATDPVLGIVARGFMATHEALCSATNALEVDLRTMARRSALSRRLMTLPGVGPIVALNFVAVVDDVSRFRKAADVGAYLGLTPRRQQSGEVDHSGRVSRCGDARMRGLLFEAATSLIRLVKRFSSLKSWAVRLAGRRGLKRAAVAARAQDRRADAGDVEERDRVPLEGRSCDLS